LVEATLWKVSVLRAEQKFLNLNTRDKIKLLLHF